MRGKDFLKNSMEQNKILKPGDLIKIIKRRRLGLIVPAFTVFALFVLIAFILKPVYRSTSTVLIEEQEIPPQYVMSTVTSYAEERLQAINQRIMSTSRLLSIINRFNLYADKRDKLTTEEIVDKMRKKDIKFSTITADVIDHQTGRPAEATIAFTVSYEGGNPQTVQQVDNELASLYLEENISIVDRKTENVTKFLGEELQSVQAKMDDLDKQIAAFKEKNPHALPELLQFNLQSLDWNERDYDELTNQLRSLQDRQNYLKTQLAAIAPDAVDQDKERLKELRVDLVNLKARYSDEYPDVIKTKVEIAQLEKKIQSNKTKPAAAGRPDNPSYIALSAELAGVQAQIGSTKGQIGELEKKGQEYRHRLQMSPKVEEGYNELVSERNDTQAKYDDLMKKFMEARVSQGLEKGQMGERFSLIDPARLPEKPVSPNQPLIIIMGFILGIGSGLVMVALQEAADSSVRRSGDLTDAFSIPVLSEIPEIVTSKDKSARRKRLIIIIAAIVLLCAASLAVINFFVMDLSVLWVRVLRHLP